MPIDASTPCIAFDGDHRLASGPLAEVARAVASAPEPSRVLIFLEASGRPIDLDLRGTPDEVVARLQPAPVEAPRGPGRPKLGVTAREVTLLPRHWDWLAAQPGGASVALRKLVEEARRNDGKSQVRIAQTALNRFMSAMAGNLPGFEEAGRALFAGDQAGFDRETRGWPQDIRDYARRLAAPAFVAPA